MKAARYYGVRDIRIEDVEEPSCEEGQIKIKPAFVGICGTGTIMEIGAGVTGFQIGQRAVVQPIIADDTCAACKRGLENVCYSGGFVGLSGWGGGLSGAVSVPSKLVIPLPDHVPLEIGALVEPLAIGWHAVRQSPLTPTSTILILGGGPVGIAIINVLKVRGCGQIIVLEPTTFRQNFAKKFGADVVLDPIGEGEDVIERRVRDLTDGEGVDIVFDCAGVTSGLKAACRLIKARGTVVNLAIWERPVMFNPNDLVFREGKYIACLGHVRQDFEETIQAIASGSMNPSPMITSKITLENVVQAGFQELIDHKEKHVKILVQM